MLAHSKEAADADHDSFDIARLVHQDVVDIADLLIFVIVYIEADDLLRSPVALQRLFRNR